MKPKLPFIYIFCWCFLGTLSGYFLYNSLEKDAKGVNIAHLGNVFANDNQNDITGTVVPRKAPPSAHVEDKIRDLTQVIKELSIQNHALNTRLSKFETSLNDITGSITPAVTGLPQVKNGRNLGSQKRFAVELGHYSTLNAAKANWRKLNKQFNKKFVKLKPIYVSEAGKYFLKAGPFESALDAMAICLPLRKANLNCREIHHKPNS